MAEIKMSLEEYQELTNKLAAQNKAVSELEHELRRAESADVEGRVQSVIDAMNVLLPVLSFAVANLDPTTVRGWPYKNLREFAKSLTRLPGMTAIQKEMAVDLAAFANEAEYWENERKTRDSD